MKFLHPLMVGMLLFGATRLTAQSGSTPVNGQNPESHQSAVAREGNPPLPQDGNGSLGPAYQGSECGLNYTTATVKIGQRFSPPGVPQPASFTISGVSGTVVQAFVWCDASGNGAPITLNVTNPGFLSYSVPMALVGTAADKCWGYAGSTTYRADVTGTIPASPNGTYTISGFPTGPPNDVDGATMIVIWRDPAANFQGNLIIWDGALVGIGTNVSQTMTGFQACNGNISNERAFMGIGDLQGFGSQMTLNGTYPVTTTEDWWNFVDVPTTVNPAQSSSVFANNVTGDCYNMALIGLYFQTDCQTTCYYPCEAKPEFKWDGCNPVTFDGRNDGVSPVVSWFWQFGDGGTSTLEDPTHAYAVPGHYKVCLTIMSVGSDGQTCCERICHDVDVCQPQPCTVKPEFHWFSNPQSHTPYTAFLTDATTFTGGSICNYYIDFGDGSPIYSGPTFPSSHTYPGPGTWEMCMTVTVCVYDAAGNVIKKCEEKVCHKITVGPNANSGRMGQPTSNRPMPSSGISVFPNPANTLVNIAINSENPVQVHILNANGQEVAVPKSLSKNFYTVDITSLAVGVYFVTVQNADGSIQKEMFVKE